MSIKLFFGHGTNGNATAKMAIDSAEPIDFDYVALVKHLFDNPTAKIITDIEATYTEEQQERLKTLVTKIEDTAKGHVNQDEQLPSRIEDIPF